MLIRDYQTNDFSRVDKLWDETGLGGRERGDTDEIIQQCLEIGGKLLIMEEEKSETIVGTSWMTFDGRRIHLHHFCIKPDYQGKGFGKILAEASLHFIRQIGAQVKIEVHKENRMAIHLYEKYGFAKFEDYNIYMIRSMDDISPEK